MNNYGKNSSSEIRGEGERVGFGGDFFGVEKRMTWIQKLNPTGLEYTNTRRGSARSSTSSGDYDRASSGGIKAEEYCKRTPQS